MANKEQHDKHMARLGPAVFIITFVVIIEFFWWFMHA